MTEPARTASEARRQPPAAPSRGSRSTQSSGAADGMLPAVITACFLPVALLAVAVHGGGVAAVVLAFAAEALITAALVLVIIRAVGGPRGRPPSG